MDVAEQVERMNALWRRRARRYWIAMGLVCCCVVGGVAVFAVCRGWEVLLLAMASGAHVLVVAGAAVLGPLLVRRGLLVAPVRPAMVRLEGEIVVINDEAEEVRIPRSAVRGATFTFFDSLDGVAGIDDALLLHLVGAADLIVGSSSNGFLELLTWLDKERWVARRGVGEEL